MNILNIHGYQGAAENAAFAAWKVIGCNVYTLPLETYFREILPALDAVISPEQK